MLGFTFACFGLYLTAVKALQNEKANICFRLKMPLRERTRDTGTWFVLCCLMRRPKPVALCFHYFTAVKVQFEMHTQLIHTNAHILH